MKIEKIGSRSTVFQFDLTDWELNLHCIAGDQFDYVIDTGLGSESVEPIKDLLKASRKPVIVINTHCHYDHIWGNHCFPGSLILSHRICRERTIEHWEGARKDFGQYTRGSVEYCPPNMVIEEGLYFPEDGIRVFYTPGHSLDSISVYDEKDKVLNAGDNIGDTMEEILPSIETEKEIYRDSIEKYRALSPAICISGHNRILDAKVFDRILSEI